MKWFRTWRSFWMLGVLLLANGSPASPAPAASPDDSGTWRFELPGSVRDELLLEVSGRGYLFLLVATGEEEIDLMRLDLTSGALERVVAGLAAESRPRLDRLVGGAGQQSRLALIQDSQLRLLDAEETSLRVPVLTFEAGSEVVIHPAEPWVAVADIGEVLVHDLGAAPRAAWRQTTPVEVSPRRNALDLSSPPLRALRSSAHTPAAFVVGPQLLGNLRVRSRIIEPWKETGSEPQNAEEAPETSSYWGMLPGLEKVDRSFFADLAGRPVLGVITLRADKQGILERKKLRLFELREDRTRTGARPFFETLTASRMWQQLEVEIADFDNDGLADLALLQPEGMGGEKLVVDIYAGRGSGAGGSAFSDRARRLVVKTPESWMTIDRDWNGDGSPDLLVRAGDELRAYSLGSSKSKTVVERPEWTLSFPEAEPVDGLEKDQRPVRRARETGGVLLLTAQYRPKDAEPGPVHALAYDRR